jgi:hypothetical protein
MMLDTIDRKSNVVYDRNFRNKSPVQFKPGNHSFCQLGDEILNGKIEWTKILMSIIRSKKITLPDLGKILFVDAKIFEKIINERDSSLLDFKTGARLLAIYDAL